MYASSTQAAGHIARRERLGVFEAKPIVRVSPPRKPSIRKPRDFLHLSLPEPVDNPEPSSKREAESAVVPLYKIAAIKWRDVLREVAEKHEMDVTTLLSKRRSYPIVRARHEACYRLLMELGMSYPAIARRVNYMDHTVVIHAVRKHAELHGLSLKTKLATEQERTERNEAICRELDENAPFKEVCDRYNLSGNYVRTIYKNRNVNTANIIGERDV